MPIYQISGWDTNFENSRSREIEHPAFVIMPNKQHGMGFQRILGQADGVAMFGLWCLILQACSRQRQNERQQRAGWLTDDGTPGGTPWDAEDLALRWKLEVAFTQRALELFSHPKVGWLKRHEAAPVCRPTADEVPTDRRPTADADGEVRQNAADRTEQNRTEQKGTTSSPPSSPARAATATPRRRVVGVEAKAVQRAIASGDLLGLVKAFGVNDPEKRSAEWARDTHNITLETVAVLMRWQLGDRTPIREPSGWRAAWARWTGELTDAYRRQIAGDMMRLLGMDVEIRTPAPAEAAP